MGFSAVGSCIRCCRFRCAPGEGTLGIPAHCPPKHGWAGGPRLCCPRCATFTVAWQAGWGCIRASRPRLPWSVRGPGLRPRPAHHRGRHPRIHPPRLVGGLSAPLWVFASSRLIPPSTGVCPFFPLPVESIPALLGFGGLCLRSVLSPSCRFEAHSSLLCTRSQLLQPCCPENELTVLKLLRLTRQLEKLIPLWSSLFFFFFKFLVCIVKTIVVSLGL